MLLIEYVGHIGLRSLTDGHLGRHLEYIKTLNDARVASVGFIKYKASTTRINKEKNFKTKFQVILGFYRTKLNHSKIVSMIWKYHNHKLQTNPWHHEEEPHNNHEKPRRQTKQSYQLSLPYQDDYKTRMDKK